MCAAFALVVLQLIWDFACLLQCSHVCHLQHAAAHMATRALKFLALYPSKTSVTSVSSALIVKLCLENFESIQIGISKEFRDVICLWLTKTHNFFFFGVKLITASLDFILSHNIWHNRKVLKNSQKYLWDISKLQTNISKYFLATSCQNSPILWFQSIKLIELIFSNIHFRQVINFLQGSCSHVYALLLDACKYLFLVCILSLKLL